MKRYFTATCFVALSLGAGAAVSIGTAEAGGDKVDVCHLTNGGNYNLLRVSASALSAHLGHGDGQPGDAVPGLEGFIFGENCTPTVDVAPEPVVGCYDEPSTSGFLGSDDLYYLGPIDTLGNFTSHTAPRDGTCTGDSYTSGAALIAAANEDDALTKCGTLVTDPEVIDYSNYPGLAGYWKCAVAFEF